MEDMVKMLGIKMMTINDNEFQLMRVMTINDKYEDDKSYKNGEKDEIGDKKWWKLNYETGKDEIGGDDKTG